MSRFDSVNCKHANLLAISRYYDTIIGAQISFDLMLTIGQCPPNLEIVKIAFGDCANDGNSIIKVHLILAERKWNDGGHNFKLQNSTNIEKEERKEEVIEFNI